MNAAVQAITINGLALAFLPTAIAIGIMIYWSAGAKTAAYATLRMLVQLLLIGYVLVYIFEAKRAEIIVAVLMIMLAAASWIAIRPVNRKQPHVFRNALIAISTGGVLVLVLVSQIVIGVEPWFSPQYVVPLAGMIFAGAMNAVSLAAERLQAETERGAPSREARRIAFQASLIPIINSLFAVGVVALPGMMTGQILSGVSPLVAAKYQIVVMSMLFGVSGISAALYLVLQSRNEIRQDAMTSR
jgi:putative ABC transport system permease protein